MKFSSEKREGITVETVHLSRATYNYAHEFKAILEKDKIGRASCRERV